MGGKKQTSQTCKTQKEQKKRTKKDSDYQLIHTCQFALLLRVARLEGLTYRYESLTWMLSFTYHGVLLTDMWRGASCFIEIDSFLSNKAELLLAFSLALSMDLIASQQNNSERVNIKKESELGSEIEEISQSEQIDESQIIKKQIQYHYQDNHQEESSVSEEEDILDELTSSPIQQKSPLCQDEESHQSTQKKQHKSKPIQKGSKSRRGKNYKCNICKGTGKKFQVIKCYKCKQYMHVNCLDVEEGSIPSPYLCQKCKFRESQKEIKVDVVNLQKVQQLAEQDIQEEDTTNYTIRTDRIFVEKLESKGRINRFDRRSRQFQQFKARYPYYVEGDKVKYPIDDRLLVIYADMLQIDEKKSTPPTNHPLIPSQYLGSLLELENWLASFEKLLKNSFPECQLPRKLDKEFLYESLEKQGYDEAFVALFCTFLRIFLADIFDGNRKQNMRMLSENSFFSLLGQIKQGGDLNDQFLAISGPQIIRHLAQVISFKAILKDIIAPTEFNARTKISLLIDLLKGLTQTTGFKMLATKKTQVIQELIQRKGKLIAKIKQAETGKLQNRQKKKEYQDLMEEEEGSQDEDNQRKKKKNKQKAKKKINEINNQNNLTEVELVQTREKLNQCVRSLQFATTETLFLGKDRNGSEFYFYRNEPYRLYVNYRPFLSDLSKSYCFYEGKEMISNFMKGLNNKGVNERRLHHNLSVLNKLNMITDNIEIEGPVPHSIKTFSCQVTKGVIRSSFQQIQRNLSQFYQKRAMQWANQEQRATIIHSLEKEDNLRNIAEIINNAQQMFLNVDIKTQNPKNVIKKAYGITFQNELRMSQFNAKKKMAMRIWGSNPEKIKKYWCDYILKESNCFGIWICLYTLKVNVDRFMKKKIEVQEGQRKKYEKMQKNQERLKTEVNSNILTSRRRPKPYQGIYDEEKYNEDMQESMKNKQEVKPTRRSLRQHKRQQDELNNEKGQVEDNQKNQSISQNDKKEHKKSKKERSEQFDNQKEEKRKHKHKHKHKNKHKKNKEDKSEQQPSNQHEDSRSKKEKHISEHQKSKSKEKSKQQRKISSQVNENSQQQCNLLPRTRRRRDFVLQSEQQVPKEIIHINKKRKQKLTFQSQSQPQSQQKQEEGEKSSSHLQKSKEKTTEQNFQNEQDLHKKCPSCNLAAQSRSLTCFQCNGLYHLACINLNRRPKTQWICPSCSTIRQTRSRK